MIIKVNVFYNGNIVFGNVWKNCSSFTQVFFPNESFDSDVNDAAF